MFNKEVIAANNSIADINRMAREARLLCNDIIRQTSLKPYYGKRGGAAMYAADDRSEAQQRRIAQAVRYMQRVTTMLHDIAVEGGTTEAKVREDMRGDYWRTKVTIIEDDSEL